MPYTANGKTVKKRDTGEVVKTHNTAEEAQKHAIALNINVGHGKSKKGKKMPKGKK